MTEADRGAAYAYMVERTTAYFAAVRAAGDVPWWDKPEKLAALGMTGMTGEEARRALFMKRYNQQENKA